MDRSELATSWRATAANLRRYGAVGEATALEACAAELEHAEREYAVEELTLEQAAGELGLKADTVGRYLRDGDLPNAGEKNRPRVRRCDLHHRTRPAGPRPLTDHGEPDLVAELLRDQA